MSTPPTELANPNIGMDNFITGLQEAGMEQAVETAKTPEAEKPAEAIAPATPPPKKDAPPVEKPQEAPKETPKEQPKEPAKESDDDKWPRSAKDWDARKAAEKKRLDALNTELTTIRTERDAIKTEIETLKKSGPSPELEQLKKDKEELDRQLRLVAVERHPKFKSHFESKTNAQIELAKRIVGPEKAEQIAALLKASDSPIKDRELSELIETMGALQQGRLSGVINDLALIDAEKQAAISAEKENYELMIKQEQEATAKRQQDYQNQFDATVKSYATNPAFQKREGDEAWNAEVESRVAAARGIVFGNQKPEYVFKAAMDAVAYPAVLRQLSDTLKTVESLQAQVAELSSATPRVDGAKSAEAPKTSPATGAPANKPGHTDPMSAIGNWMGAMNQGMDQ